MSVAEPQFADMLAPGRLPGLPHGFQWNGRGGVPWIEAPLPGARAAFSTRVGGFSGGPYAALNLGVLSGDDPALVARNRVLLATALGRDAAAIALGFQVHGSDLQVHTDRPQASAYEGDIAPAKADAQVTDRPEITPLVLAGDCVPLVLSGPGAVAAVHCGWRGVAAGIVGGAVAAVGELADAAAPGGLSAALGPGIGPCCYRIGDELRSAFRERGHEAAAGVTLDLPGVIRAELGRAGLDPAAVFSCGLCTSCNSALFFSHRRDDGVTGRQAGLAWLEP